MLSADVLTAVPSCMMSPPMALFSTVTFLVSGLSERPESVIRIPTLSLFPPKVFLATQEYGETQASCIETPPRIDGNDTEIYPINASGGGKKQLTDNSTRDRFPYYSPSGERIAYSGFDGTDYEIYTMKVGGGDKLNVTDNTSDDYNPDYAPNGERIAYTNNVSGGDEEIYTINASGGGELNVTDNDTGDFYPSYSPSGKRIAFVNDAGADREIYTIKPNGEGKHQVIDNITANFNPYWGSQ